MRPLIVSAARSRTWWGQYSRQLHTKPVCMVDIIMCSPHQWLKQGNLHSQQMGGVCYNGRSTLQWEHLHVLILHELSEDVVQLLSHRLELEKVTEHHHLCM